jgi:peptidyl-prolyl cis-trans isomerase D
MFEFIRTHQRLMQFLLLLFIFPSFAFFGLESYTRFRDHDNGVAKVAGQSISQQELDAAQREQMERFRQMLGEQFDPKMFDTPEMRKNILNTLIDRRVLLNEANKNHLNATDAQLQSAVLNYFPNLADPSLSKEQRIALYNQIANAQGLTIEQFQARLAQSIALENLSSAVQSTAIAPKSVATRLSDLNDQEREVQELLFKASDFVGQVKVTDQMLKDYYDKHAAQFEVPEQIKAEYVVLSIDTIASQISVSDDDIKSYYEQNQKHYTTEEERRVRHIEINAKPDANAAEKVDAKAKAERLLAQLRKNPGDFAKLAKENSQDTISAEKGGDLGFITHGSVPKEFEDVAFKLKQDQLSDVVQVGSNYHIIQVTEIKPGTIQPLEAVKADIAAEIKKQLAAKKYSELAEQFTNTVYEQADSLKPVADKLKLKVETIEHVTRAPNPALPPKAPFNQPKFLNALFSDEAVKNKHNTEAIEVAPSTLIAGHVLEYKPVTKRPFAEVEGIVREQVTQNEAANLAKKAGEEKLAALRAGGNVSGFGEAKNISRVKPQGIQPAAVPVVMKADVSKLPIYVGTELPGQGYALYRINKVAQPTNIDTARRAAEQQQIAGVLGQQDMQAYLKVLRKRAKVEIVAPTAKNDQDGGAKI